MGIFSVIGTLISAMIGSAIFSLSGKTIELGGGYSIISWVIAGAIMLLYAILVCQLSLTFPKSGGLYYFPRLSFSSRPILASALGFISAIGTVVCNIIAVGFSAALVPIFLNVNSNLYFPIAFLTIIICSIFNLLKLSLRGKLNTGFAVVLSVLLVSYSIAIFASPSFSANNIKESFAAQSVLSAIIKTSSSVPIATLGYGAIVSICFIAGSVKNKKRDIPLGVLIAGVVVIVLYCMAIFATISVVGTKNLGGSVFSLAINKAFNSNLAPFISFAVVIALISTINVVTNISIETLCAISEDGLLPKVFLIKTKAGVPCVSLLVFTILSSLTLINNYVFNLISLGAIFSILTIIINLVSYLKVYRLKSSKFISKNGNTYAIIALVLLIVSSFSSILADTAVLNTTILFTSFVIVICMCIFFSMIDKKNKTPLVSALCIDGEVRHGNALGRLVDMPTANIYPTTKQLDMLKDHLGVWASFVYVDGEKFSSLTNIGTRPSVDEDARIVVESHILDGFDRDIYGKNIRVELIEFIRPVVKLGSLQDVKSQVERDKKVALEIFSRTCRS